MKRPTSVPRPTSGASVSGVSLRVAKEILDDSTQYAMRRMFTSREPTWHQAMARAQKRFPDVPADALKQILQSSVTLGLKGAPRVRTPRRPAPQAPQVLAISCTLSRAASPIAAPVMKFGGSPAFVAQATWPKCVRCRRELDFLGQIPLQVPLRLSKRFSMAYLFLCEGYDNGEMARSHRCGRGMQVLLQRRSGRPFVEHRATSLPEFKVTMRRAQEPEIDTGADDVDDRLLDSVDGGTKLGGVPLWQQSSERPRCPSCKGSMRFVAQVESELDGPLPAGTRNWGRYWSLSFGDAGTGYLFLCERECGPLGAKLVIQF